MAETLSITLSQYASDNLRKFSEASNSEAMRKIVVDNEVPIEELAKRLHTTSTTCTLDEASKQKIKAVADALNIKAGKALRLIIEANVDKNP